MSGDACSRQDEADALMCRAAAQLMRTLGAAGSRADLTPRVGQLLAGVAGEIENDSGSFPFAVRRAALGTGRIGRAQYTHSHSSLFRRRRAEKISMRAPIACAPTTAPFR